MVYKPHSSEVKLLALAALERGVAVPTIETLYGVDRRSIFRWKAQVESTFTLARQHSAMVGRPRAIPAPLLHVLTQLLDETPSERAERARLRAERVTNGRCVLSEYERAGTHDAGS
ncbi:hypothetical protein R3P38DRAFT_3179619 [Favolaschia claudopus]|uniref:Transposase n=1 Tax=Favolaschia claudopus TaxID=2862362 RepID=A0AAW0CQU9_9AGAR